MAALFMGGLALGELCKFRRPATPSYVENAFGGEDWVQREDGRLCEAYKPFGAH
ncbi:hypothetical protein CTA1_2141 [Colletotrichum tanaceti]|uniref:Uncharacterized protein n=1 Tax=Colletotrichum tanaceti TaxID=1306861 RepID=A0A4U6XLE6_9PEZI|nr:hypothetical protein CTA1_2141 [Colletotrichum tanaceti]